MLSGKEIPAFDTEPFTESYRKADKADKDDTVLGKFIIAALAQKSMVTNRIWKTGNLLAGYSVDYRQKGFRGIRDFRKLIEISLMSEKK